jgi:hypothetical protein
VGPLSLPPFTGRSRPPDRASTRPSSPPATTTTERGRVFTSAALRARRRWLLYLMADVALIAGMFALFVVLMAFLLAIVIIAGVAL